MHSGLLSGMFVFCFTCSVCEILGSYDITIKPKTYILFARVGCSTALYLHTGTTLSRVDGPGSIL